MIFDDKSPCTSGLCQRHAREEIIAVAGTNHVGRSVMILIFKSLDFLLVTSFTINILSFVELGPVPPYGQHALMGS